MLSWIHIKHSGNNYHITVPPKCSHHCQGAIVAAHKTIDHIVEKYPPPYILYVSGGADSQAMLWAWHTSGVPYTAVSYVYNNTLNLHDLNAGMPEFANRYNISIQRRSIDLLEFYENRYQTYAEQYRCGSPHIAAYMYMADQQHSGTVIFSGSATVRAHSFYTANEWRLYHYGNVSGRSIVPAFFSETQQLHYAFVDVVSASDNKFDVYHKAGFPVIPQIYKTEALSSTDRYSGFEGIKQYYEKLDLPSLSLQQKMQRLPGQTSNSKYDMILRNPWEWKFRNDIYRVDYMDTQ